MRYVQARNYTHVVSPPRPIRKIVVHTAEMSAGDTSAENLAQYGATTVQQVSWHFATDNDSVVQCVRVEDVAWAAPGANHDGIQIEVCARASQTRAEWFSQPGLLDVLAGLVADLCKRYGIPVRELSAAELMVHPDAAGITTHAAVSEAFKRSTHTDPGSGFPMDWLLGKVQGTMKPRLRAGRVVVKDHGTPVGAGTLKQRRFVKRVGVVLRRDGQAAPYLARDKDGNVVGDPRGGRLWYWTRPFNRSVNRLVRTGTEVFLSKNVSLELEGG